MITKHFFKILTSFIVMILVGIVSLFIIGRIDQTQKKEESHDPIPNQVNGQSAQLNGNWQSLVLC